MNNEELTRKVEESLSTYLADIEQLNPMMDAALLRLKNTGNGDLKQIEETCMSRTLEQASETLDLIRQYDKTIGEGMYQKQKMRILRQAKVLKSTLDYINS